MQNKNLNYFIGKACTIFTQPINRNFKEENPNTFPKQSYHYFVGIVETIDDRGIRIQQLQTGLRSYFFMDHIISIAEEEMLDPKKETDAKTIDTIKKSHQEVVDKYKPAVDQFLDIDAMSKLVKNGKNE